MCVGVHSGVVLVPCASALLFSACVLYLWRVYRRRLHYVKAKLREAGVTVHVTDDDQSHDDDPRDTNTAGIFQIYVNTGI